MYQVWRIFRKDVRHLLPAIAAVLGLVIAHAVLEVLSDSVYIPATERINSTATLMRVLLPLGICFLIAQLVYQEAIPGDRQFWLTRPYQWTNLLAAKVLFVFVFFSIPLFASDCYILRIQGFEVIGVMPEILLRQLLVPVLFVLPAFAIASITTGLLQFVMAVFIFALALVLEFLMASRGPGSSVSWGNGPTAAGILVVALSGVIVWQYWRRRTTAARLFLLITALAFLPASWTMSRVPWLHASRPVLPYSPQGLNIQFDYARRLNYDLLYTQTQAEHSVLTQIPLAVAGLPPNTLLRGNTEITVEAGGKRWPEAGTMLYANVRRVNNQYWQEMNLPKDSASTLVGKTVNLHATFRLEIVNDRAESAIKIRDSWFRVPNIGHCHLVHAPIHDFLTCREGPEESIETSVFLVSPRGPMSLLADVPSFTIPLLLSPTSQTLSSDVGSLDADSAIIAIPRRRVAEFQRSIEANGIDLTKYMRHLNCCIINAR